ncbi:MAG: glycosyltransferase, partial [Bacilli bacterium]|nr:glycosyltransferase [Bacilli bacterium]
IEIIILNDGSTDSCHDKIKKYNDSRIIYINKDNDGISITRNKGIDLATGEFITFVDSDDYIDITFCEKMYNKAKKDNCDVVMCDYYNKEDNLYVKKKIFDFKDSLLKDNPSIINEINLGPCNKIYKSTLILDNNIKFPENTKYEDAPFVVSALSNAAKIGKVNEPLSYFNVHLGSQTTTRDEKIFDIFKIIELVRNILKDNINEYNINKLTIDTLINYAVQSRYIEDKVMRVKFIDEIYCYLETNIPNWKINDNFVHLSIMKKLVLKNKNLLKIYCTIYLLRK